MKLRLFENNIRLRLTQAEVQSLAQGTAVQTSTRFFSGELHTQVQVSSAAKDISATLLEGGRIQEVGTHRDLLAKEGGLYRRLYRLQFATADDVAADLLGAQP